MPEKDNRRERQHKKESTHTDSLTEMEVFDSFSIRYLRRLYLDVVVWVPIRVVDDDSVGGCQVDAQTPCSGGQEENKLRSTRSCSERKEKDFVKTKHPLCCCYFMEMDSIFPLTIESIDGFLPHPSSHPSVYPFILVPLILQKVFQQIQHLCHLHQCTKLLQYT